MTLKKAYEHVENDDHTLKGVIVGSKNLQEILIMIETETSCQNNLKLALSV